MPIGGLGERVCGRADWAAIQEGWLQRQAAGCDRRRAQTHWANQVRNAGATGARARLDARVTAGCLGCLGGKAAVPRRLHGSWGGSAEGRGARAESRHPEGTVLGLTDGAERRNGNCEIRKGGFSDRVMEC